MNRGQTDKLNSFIKSFDVLTDNAAALTSVTQIAAGRIALKATIDAITTAAGTGNLDLTGYTEDKRNKREAVMTLLQKVSRAAAAYYNSVGNVGNLNKVDFTPSELVRMRDTDFYANTKAIHTLILPDAANLIGATAADLTALNAANELFFAALQEPKNQAELSKVANDSINGLLAQGDEQRKSLDIYMLTFADDQPALYALWKLSLGIDNTGGTNPPVLVIPATLEGTGDVLTIDYNGVDMQGNTEIKVRNSGPSVIMFGFGPNATAFVGQPQTLAPEATERFTAASLSYDAAQARFFNMRIDQQAQANTEVLVEFYEMG